MYPIGAGKSPLKIEPIPPKKCKTVSRVYVNFKAVNEKYILFNGTYIIHTDSIVKQNNYKHYY